MNKTAIILMAACLIRVTTNSVWPFLDSPHLYYLGQALFEVLVMYVLVSFSEGWLKSALTFFFGCACYALLKEFLSPAELDLNEYIGFLVGAAFTSVFIWRTSKNS